MKTSDGDQPRPYATWLAHHRQHILMVWVLSMLPLVLISLPPEQRIYVSVTNFVAALSTSVAGVADFRHRAILCARCIAQFVVNGSEEAAQRIKLLWIYHYHTLTICGIWIVAAILSGFTSWFLLLAGAAGLTDFYIEKTHRRLVPWCPYCRRRDDDDEEVPTPVPTRTAER